MDIISQIKIATSQVLQDQFGFSLPAGNVQVNETKPEFEGDYTVVLFSFVKSLKKSPEALGAELGQALAGHYPQLFAGYNVIKGFLNLTVADNYWLDFLGRQYANDGFGHKPSNGQKVMVEYSSPNTNKPLHLGHLRNKDRKSVV